MPYKGPHISLTNEELIPRVLGISAQAVTRWPEQVRHTAAALAGELFLIRSNPFIDPETIWRNVQSSFARGKLALATEYARPIETGLFAFWHCFRDDERFKQVLMHRVAQFLPPQCIDMRAGTRLEMSTDATDLRMELPLLVLLPETTEHIAAIVRLAKTLKFHLVPRGGGSGLTGGAIPMNTRCVIISLSRLKRLVSLDEKKQTLCTQAGVITLDAMEAAAEKKLLFTVDPASRASSSIGGNIAENSGGPFAFEYGTTLDNLLSYTMVTPQGDCIVIERKDHPGHKIMPEETAVFAVQDQQGSLLHEIRLTGTQLRGPGLGKDVTNKYLGGLPGVQKEGVDGIITQACFILHPTLAYSRVLCLEFFGQTMNPAMQVIKEIVALRDAIRQTGNMVTISALEEFGIKYVQAIDYHKKSSRYEGLPISVLLVQLDSDNAAALEESAQRIRDMAKNYDNVDCFMARNPDEAEAFWSDRHRLSAIARRTSGFKINEDVVIPLECIPEFSDFIESLNLLYMAKAYHSILQDVQRVYGIALQDEFIAMEYAFSSQIISGEVTTARISDQELEMQAFYFFLDLKSRYPDLKVTLDQLHEQMQAGRIIIANHMHAGDGNCHINIPVNSNDAGMMSLAHEAVESVIDRVNALGGAASGEHGIGITKIAFLPSERIDALRAYKKVMDPHTLFNPGKLTESKPALKPYTFSFNSLIGDLARTGLPDKERLMSLLTNIQICTRCGKCKQVCPLYAPVKGLMFHPRNKNISLGGLIEAIYYNQIVAGQPGQALLDELRILMEHCTACGKCVSVCPVKVNTPDATLGMRTFLEEKGAGGHPIKAQVLKWLARDPALHIPRAGKVLSVAASVNNRLLSLSPGAWRKRVQSPLWQTKSPRISFISLAETLHLEKGSFFVPDRAKSSAAVFYFPGCGAGVFSRSVGMAGIYLLLKVGVRVLVAPEHMCCGYPLISSGYEDAFHTNRSRNLETLSKVLEDARAAGLVPDTVLTSCGTCREGLREYHLEMFSTAMKHQDVFEYLSRPVWSEQLKGYMQAASQQWEQQVLFHAGCHAQWSGVSAVSAAKQYGFALEELTGADVVLSPGCCGEAGMGALSSPGIYNRLREVKRAQLEKDYTEVSETAPVLVGCPSCMVGIRRSLAGLTGKARRERCVPVLHALEFVAQCVGGMGWKKELNRLVRSSRSVI